jgi:hypothetical protein
MKCINAETVLWLVNVGIPFGIVVTFLVTVVIVGFAAWSLAEIEDNC